MLDVAGSYSTISDPCQLLVGKEKISYKGLISLVDDDLSLCLTALVNSRVITGAIVYHRCARRASKICCAEDINRCLT